METLRACDIIFPGSHAADDATCYVCSLFKYLNCLRYTKHIATLAEFVLLASYTLPEFILTNININLFK
jgi:hypothetical protein